jgi:hypothetical protein
MKKSYSIVQRPPADVHGFLIGGYFALARTAALRPPRAAMQPPRQMPPPRSWKSKEYGFESMREDLLIIKPLGIPPIHSDRNLL